MNDNREPIKNGTAITYNGKNLRVTELIGRGGVSLAYKTEYDDTLISGGKHICIVKELFPLHPKNAVYRDKDGSIRYDGAEEFFESRKKSFILGNKTHLEILEADPDSVGANYDSFEANNTVYSLLGLNSAYTLRRRCGDIKTLKDVTRVAIKLLKAVGALHKKGILHLDISPDNIIIPHANGDERVLLIDFNGSDGEYMSVNPTYSAPEIKLGRRNDISEASDIFSVCATLVFMISGRDFVYAALNDKELLNSPILKNAPPTAVSCLMGILAKGLRSRPSLRFASAEEMLHACRELENRLLNVGVTRASLWEASRVICGDEEKELIDNNVMGGGRIIPSTELITMGNTVLSGDGGIGKTTLYRRILYENTRAYMPDKPIGFIVPLNEYDGKSDFIKRYIVSKIRFGNGVSTVSDAVNRLDELMRGSKPLLYLMLDGFNEIKDSGGIILEINELSKMSAVTVSVSLRRDTLTEYLENFVPVTLLPIENEQARQYVNSHGAAYPEDENTARLLTNPLMLTLYVKSETVFRESSAAKENCTTESEIINRYLDSISESYRRAAPNDKCGQTRLNYVLKYLFPEICASMKGGANVNFDGVRSVCAADYRRLKSRAFSRAFREFAGKTDEILGGAKNADEWMNIAAEGILVRDTALLKNEKGVYSAAHMNFCDCLSPVNKENSKRYRKAAMGVRVPLTAAVIAVCLCASAVTYRFMPGTHPLGRREEKNNYEIMTTVAVSLNNVVQMTSSEKNLIEELESNDMTSGTESVREAGERLDALGDAAVTIENLDEKAYRGLDTERVDKILSMSREHRAFQKDMFERLEHALSPESGYDADTVKRNLGYYSEYISCCEKLMGYELCLLTRTISEKGGGVIKEAMKGSGDVVMDFNGALEISTADLENSVHSLELRMNYLESIMSEIKGDET